jgi:hypothetical protein
MLTVPGEQARAFVRAGPDGHRPQLDVGYPWGAGAHVLPR